MRTKNNNTSRISNPSFTILGFLGVYFVVCAAIAPFVAYGFLQNLAVFALIFILMAFGYFLQAGVSAATGFKRELETRAYEPEYKHFKQNRAFPVWVIALILSVFVSKLTDMYLFERSKQPTVVYDPDSILPFLAAATFVIVVALGSFVWFFPYNRIMTAKGLYIGVTVNLVVFSLHSMVRSPGVVTVGVCLIGYAFCALVAANQYSLGRTYRGTIVSFMTPQTRKYNLLLSLGLVGFFCILLFLAYLIVNGLRVCVLFVLAAIIRAFSDEDVGYTEEEDEISSSLSDMLWGKQDAVSSANYWLFWIFVVFSIILLIVVLIRRRAEFQRFVAWLKAWIVSLFEIIWLPIRDQFEHEDYYFTNYVDEELKLQKNELKAKRREENRARMTWSEFNLSLRMKKSEEEKYRFAYSTFVSQLLKMPMFVRKSDTPRKICERLTASGRVASNQEIEMITEAFEQIEFADRPATPETEKALDALCDKIRENM